MMENILDSNIAQAGGISSVVGTFLISIYEWVTMDNVNDLLELTLATGGLIFLWYKIQGQRLDNKKKKKT